MMDAEERQALFRRSVEGWNAADWEDELKAICRADVVSVESIGEQVLGHVRWSVKGEASGAPLEVALWILCDFRDGRLARMHHLLDGDSARAAVGEAA